MEARQAVATPGGLRWAEGRGYGSSHSTSRYIYSFFVLRMFANPSRDDFKSVIGKSKERSEGGAGIILYH